MNQLIADKGCRNCRFAIMTPNKLRECRYGPPTANAVLVPNNRSEVSVAGIISVFPHMQPDAFCHKWERGIAIRLEDAAARAS